MSLKYKPVYYGEYLKLESLLDSQKMKSVEYNSESHDEMLFIIVHQVFEMWFKQILHEIDSIHTIFSQDSVEEPQLHTVVQRLERIIKIQPLFMSQLNILETMTPMDFLDFREMLVPASGFQSYQFREIEIKLGLSTSSRDKIDRSYFLGRLNQKHRSRLEQIEEGSSLFDLMEKWLERMPFVRNDHYNFWDEYKQSVEKMLAVDKEIVERAAAGLGDKEKEVQLENLKSTQATFESLFDKDLYEKLRDKGKRRLSQRATFSALFILLYRDEPMLTLPYQFLRCLMDIDENFTSWRYKHSLLAQRMLGTKIGTGGSAGHRYLKQAAESNSIYMDLFNLATFLVPRSELPELPREIKQMLNYHFTERDQQTI